MKAKTYKSYSKAFELEIKERNEQFHKAKVTTSTDVYNYVRKFYFDDIEIYESFFILMLNNQQNTIGWAKIGQGGLNMATVDVRLIAKFAVECLAVSVICCHNHPSGNILPSQNDIDLTRRIKAGLETLNIKLLDHIILSPEAEKFYSFADEGQI